MEIKDEEANPRRQYISPWLLRYIVTIETAVIVMLVGFYATGWQELVTKTEMKSYNFPYLRAEPVIQGHIQKSEKALDGIITSLNKLNDRISAESHAATLRIALLEKDVGAMKR